MRGGLDSPADGGEVELCVCMRGLNSGGAEKKKAVCCVRVRASRFQAGSNAATANGGAVND